MKRKQTFINIVINLSSSPEGSQSQPSFRFSLIDSDSTNLTNQRLESRQSVASWIIWAECRYFPSRRKALEIVRECFIKTQSAQVIMQLCEIVRIWIFFYRILQEHGEKMRKSMQQCFQHFSIFMKILGQKRF